MAPDHADDSVTAGKSTNPVGVHFVGSVPFDTTEEVFDAVLDVLPNHIMRLPDGEPAVRSNWVNFQTRTFAHAPRLQRAIDSKLPPSELAVLVAPADIPGMLFPDDNNNNSNSNENRAQVLNTGYAEAALESYTLFAASKRAGRIPPTVRFQVSVPTPLAAVWRAIDPRYQAIVEPIWEEALVRDLRTIQNHIPHSELAVQFDLMSEVFLLEEAWEREPVRSDPLFNAFGSLKPWFSNHREGVYERLRRVLSLANVDPDVEMGIHLCYGDLGHRHFMEPESTALLAAMIQSMLDSSSGLDRSLQWVHLPVPKDRVDDGYLKPLQHILPILQEAGTILYLGLVHADDLDGTKERIRVAQRVLGHSCAQITWGVATECGMGRTPKEKIAEILSICKEVARPVSSSMFAPVPSWLASDRL